MIYNIPKYMPPKIRHYNKNVLPHSLARDFKHPKLLGNTALTNI